MKTLSLAALAATLFVAPAMAQQPAGDYRTHVVSYADLDLGTAKGVTTLDRRIRTAVREVCGTASDFDLEGKNNVRACRADLLDRFSVHREQIVAAARQPATVIAASR